MRGWGTEAEAEAEAKAEAEACLARMACGALWRRAGRLVTQSLPGRGRCASRG